MSNLRYEVINGVYYHIITEYFDDDKTIARTLKMELSNYQDLLINRFGAIQHYDIVIFLKYRKMLQALDYLNEYKDSLNVVKKLIGE